MADNLPSEPSHRRWGRYLYGSAGLALVVGLILASLSAAGIIAMNLAYLLLGLAWGGGVIGLYLAEPLWGIPKANRTIVLIFGAVALGFLCIGIGFYEKAAATNSDDAEIHGIAKGIKALLDRDNKKPAVLIPPPLPKPPAGLMEPLPRLKPLLSSPKKQSKKVEAEEKKDSEGSIPLSPAVQQLLDKIRAEQEAQEKDNEERAKEAAAKALKETDYNIGKMAFIAYAPVVVDSDTRTRIRVKLYIGISGDVGIPDSERTDVEYYDFISRWKILTPHVTCHGDPKSVDPGMLSLIPRTGIAQYVEFVCPRAVPTGDTGTMEIVLKQKATNENGLFEYDIPLPQFP